MLQMEHRASSVISNLFLTLFPPYKWWRITLNRQILRGAYPQKKELFHQLWNINLNIGKIPTICPWKGGETILFDHLKGFQLLKQRRRKTNSEPFLLFYRYCRAVMISVFIFSSQPWLFLFFCLKIPFCQEMPFGTNKNEIFHLMKKNPLLSEKKRKERMAGPYCNRKSQWQIAIGRGEGMYHIAEGMWLETCNVIVYRGK